MTNPQNGDILELTEKEYLLVVHLRELAEKGFNWESIGHGGIETIIIGGRPDRINLKVGDKF